MCLIFFSWKSHPAYKFILAANRDEFYERPTTKAEFWDTKDIFAGRDLKAKGTWLGVSKSGKFGALTNYRDPSMIKSDAISRGRLIVDYLEDSALLPEKYLKESVSPEVYNPFNLLIGNVSSLFYYNNIEKRVQALSAGTYGLSNALLDADWPKVRDGKKKLTEMINSQTTITQAHLFGLLSDRSLASDQDLPSTGVPYEWEKQLSAKYIQTDSYGTRCSTVLLLDYDGNLVFTERTFLHGKIDEVSEVSESFCFN